MCFLGWYCGITILSTPDPPNSLSALSQFSFFDGIGTNTTMGNSPLSPLDRLLLTTHACILFWRGQHVLGFFMLSADSAFDACWSATSWMDMLHCCIHFPQPSFIDPLYRATRPLFLVNGGHKGRIAFPGDGIDYIVLYGVAMGAWANDWLSAA